jgi:hypothetical protein
MNQPKRSWYKLKSVMITTAVFVIAGTTSVLFQNCGSSNSTSRDGGLTSKTSTEEQLFELVQESENLQKKLASFDISADKDSEILKETQNVLSALKKKTDQIVKMVTVDKVPTNSNDVLVEVDLLVNLLSKARDIHVTYDSIRRDRLLDIKFTDLIAALQAEFGEFKALAEDRFDNIDTKIDGLESLHNQLKRAFEDFVESAAVEDAILKDSLLALQESTEAKILSIREQGQLLNERLTNQETATEEAKEALKQVTNLQDKICKLDDQGNYIKVGSCINIDEVKCAEVVPNPTVNVAAVNQCQIMVDVVKNHDQQLRALRDVDEKQNQLISNIVEDIKNINTQVQTAADALASITESIGILDSRISSINERLLIVEFKAKKAEAAASIKSKASFYLSWIAQRTADVNREFCVNGTKAALNRFDYEAGNHQWAFCHEKLRILNDARVVANTALAFAGDLESLNVESKCEVPIVAANNLLADSLNQSELVKEAVAKEVIQKCSSVGGMGLAKTLMINSVKYLAQLGPDHRTYDYFAALAPIASIIFLGEKWEEVSPAVATAFENNDPTSEALKNTYYGQIERLFVNRFINTVYRKDGKFPSDPNDVKIPDNIGYVFTWNQINAAQPVGPNNGAQYMARLKALEIGCSDCGFNMADRNVHGREGKARFSYPLDGRDNMCPVDDHVIVEQGGKFFPYHISYSHVVENFKPFLIQGNHSALVESTDALSKGEYLVSHERVQVPRAGFQNAQIPMRWFLRATRPYGNSYARPHCVKFTMVRGLKNGEWEKPADITNANGIAHYLNGFDKTYVETSCKSQTYPIRTFESGRTPDLATAGYSEDRDGKQQVTLLRQSWNQPSGSNASSNSQGLVSHNATQLTDKYYVYRDTDKIYAKTTSQNFSFGKSKPFFRPVSEAVGSQITGTNLIREFDPQAAINIQECSYCKRDNNLKNLNPNCDATHVNDTL